MKRKVDWTFIKEEYVNGNISYRQLAKKYGLTFNSVQSTAQKEGWFFEKRKKQGNFKSGYDNFIPFNKMSEKRQKEIQQEGTKANQRKSKERAKAKECMEVILSLNVKSEKIKKQLYDMGIHDEQQQNIMLLMVSLFQNGVKTGDPTVIKNILEIVGESTVVEDQSPTININVQKATEKDINDMSIF